MKNSILRIFKVLCWQGNQVRMILTMVIFCSCGKVVELRPPKKAINVLGGYLEEVKTMDEESLQLARKICSALAQKRSEIRPGLNYSFSLKDSNCSLISPITVEVVSVLEDGEGGWEWKLPQNSTLKFFKKMIFEDSPPFEKFCQLVKDGQLKSFPDTIQEGSKALKFQLAKLDSSMAQVDVFWAYTQSLQDVPYSDLSFGPFFKKVEWFIQKKEQWKIYLGSTVQDSLVSLPTGTELLHSTEELCEKGQVNKTQHFMQTLIKIE